MAVTKVHTWTPRIEEKNDIISKLSPVLEYISISVCAFSFHKQVIPANDSFCGWGDSHCQLRTFMILLFSMPHIWVFSVFRSDCQSFQRILAFLWTTPYIFYNKKSLSSKIHLTSVVPLKDENLNNVTINFSTTTIGQRLSDFIGNIGEKNWMDISSQNLKRRILPFQQKKHIFLTLFFAKLWPYEVGRHFGYKIWVWKPLFQEDCKNILKI